MKYKMPDYTVLSAKNALVQKWPGWTPREEEKGRSQGRQ
jgi:hypothetical protein